jgi:diaminopimelate decarboxylase
MIDFLADLRQRLGYMARDLDIGGGLGVAYTPSDLPTPIAAFGNSVMQFMRAYCIERGILLPHLMVEPGRSVVANAGVTLYTVGTIKKLPGIRNYVSVDGGMTDNIRTALYGATYESVIANRASRQRDYLATIVGKHCESGDVIAVDASIQTPEAGDILCTFGTGAYCYTMSSNYNKQVRPGVVFVMGGRVREVVKRETYKDLMACDLD